MGEVHHRKTLTVGSLGLTAIRGDEKVRLIDESAPDVKGVERPQGMTFEAAKGLVEGILGEVTDIGVGEVGLQGGFEAPVVPGGKPVLAHQPAQSRDQLGYDQDADSQCIRRGAEGSHLL